MAPKILDGEDAAADLLPNGSKNIHHVDNMPAMLLIRSHPETMREHFDSMHLPKKHISCKVARDVGIFIIGIFAIVLVTVTR